MDNSVFISHSLSDYATCAVFQDLEAHGINAFLDVDSIHSSQFEKVIFSQIEARPYFVVILAPGSLERCNQPHDWLRREIEHAIASQRIIIPLLISGFKFDANYAKPYLTGELAKLSTYNSISVSLDFFPEAMTRLREFLLKPIECKTSKL
ncbi:MAG: toll/interleukin-1 receptor domain-containing protein [Chloroflexota bacterium]